MEFNNITYGNPTLEERQSIDAECLVGDLFFKLKEINSSIYKIITS